jgi:O-antigen/teichoic acid export membrane protein
MFKAAWAIADQGLFAVANFAVTVMMARWLSPYEYGAFTLAFTIFLLLGTIHSAMVVEPMMVFGAGKYSERWPAYFAFLLQGHWLLTSGASLLLAAAGAGLMLVGQPVVGRSLLTLAAASPFILLLWLVRRSCCLTGELRRAAFGGMLYLVFLVASTYLLVRAGWLSAPSVFVLMGIGSLGAALSIRAGPSSGVLPESVLRRAVTADHWAFGRWAVGTGLLSALTLNVYYMVLPVSHGLEATATLRALLNLMMPALQASMAIAMVTMPSLVRARGTSAFDRLLYRLLALFSAGGVLYWLCLGLSHEHLFRWLYGDRYSENAHLLWVVGLVPIACTLSTAIESSLRALERSDHVFRAHAFATVATCVVGVPLLLRWGLVGAIVGMLVAYAVAISSMVMSLRLQPALRLDAYASPATRPRVGVPSEGATPGAARQSSSDRSFVEATVQGVARS